MNKTLRRTTIFALLLFFALMVNVNYIQGSRAQKLRDDPLNARTYLEQFKRDRGPIMAGRKVLAYSRDTGGKTFRYQRVYNDPEVFAPVTGYLMASGSKTGVEEAADHMLDGTDPRLTVHRWFDEILGRQAKGATVSTTVDPQAQEVAYDALRASTGRRAAAVALDVKTGAIKVMASYPSFDTNDIAGNDGEKANRAFTRLLKAGCKPLLDKAIDEGFPPGSSFKIVTASTAIESRGLSTDSPVDTPAVLTLPSGNPLHNAEDAGPCTGGSLPLIDAFAESCNSTFGKLALDMGASTLRAGANRFGFGDRIPIEQNFSGAASVFPSDLSGDDLGRSGIGQGDVSATPLQMALAADAVANGGVAMKPYVIDRITAPDQSELEVARPERLHQATSAETAGMLRQMMEAVVQRGTARGVVPSDIAGKTGTAETGLPYNERWFVGYAPANDPKVAFAVVTEGTGFGADAAGPIATKIVRALGIG